ncbi:MAG: hypothetical protein PHP54_04395 [Clostridia bacterium]|nr:hypothetical protein [Clostridia bacterium]
MKKGISLLMLTTIVLVMLVISTTVVISGKSAIDNSTKIKFANEVFYLQGMIDAYVQNNQGDFPVEESIIVDLSKVSPEMMTQFSAETKNNNTITLHKIDMSKLSKTELRYGKEKNKEDIYGVSKETGIVYYVQGIKVNNKSYYTLNSELEALIDYDTIDSPLSKDGIIFKPSTTTWTNKDITVKTSVPKKYNVLEATVKNASNAIIASLQGVATDNYMIYDATNVGENCYVEIKYQRSTSDTTVLRQVYTADNVDKTPIAISNIITKVMQETNGNEKKISISFDVLNDISGLKVLKYEAENIQESVAKSYFQANGILIQNNNIVVDGTIKHITIYAEDNAGNGVVKGVQL